MYLGNILTDYTTDIFKVATKTPTVNASWSVVKAGNPKAIPAKIPAVKPTTRSLPEFMQVKAPKPKIQTTSIFEPQMSPLMMPVSRSSTNAYSVVGQDTRPAPVEESYVTPEPWYKQRQVMVGGAGAALVLLALFAARGKK